MSSVSSSLDGSTAPRPAERYMPRQLAGADDPQDRHWRPRLRTHNLVLGIAFGVLAVFVGWWAWADAASLVDVYGHNLHVFLAPFAIVILWWRRRKRLPYLRVGGQWFGLLIASLGFASIFVGGQAGVSMLFHLGALLLAVGAIVSVCGRNLILRMMPVFFAGLFFLPLPGRARDWLTQPMISITRSSVRAIFDLLNLTDPVARVGYEATADACDGLPLAMALLVIVYTFAFSTTLRNGYRWLLLLLVPILAIVLNIVRAVPVLWLASHAVDAPDADRWDQLATNVGTLSDFLLPAIGIGLVAAGVAFFDWVGLHIYRYRLAG